MTFQIENTQYYSNNDLAIIRFNVNSKISKSKNIEFKSNFQYFYYKEDINFYIPSSSIHSKFKSQMLQTPTYKNKINMFDFNGNNIGMYEKDRIDNSKGGNIKYIETENIFISNINIKDIKGNNVILMENYFPFDNLTDEGIIGEFINEDLNKMNNKFKNSILFINKSMFDSLCRCRRFGAFEKFFRTVYVVENVVNGCLEKIFGRVIYGETKPISKFIKINGGDLMEVLSFDNNCQTIQRSNNRINYISDNTESGSIIIGIIDNLNSELSIQVDDQEYIFENSLNIDVTPNLEAEFYFSLFDIFKFYNEMKNSENKKIFFIENARIAMEIILRDYYSNNSNFNVTEKILVNYYNKIIEKVNREFNNTKFRNKMDLSESNKFNSEKFNSNKIKLTTLTRQTTC